MATDLKTPQQQRLIRRPEVEARTGLSRSTIYDWMKQGQFPQPVKLGERLVAWRESDIAAWLDTRQTRGGLVMTPVNFATIKKMARSLLQQVPGRVPHLREETRMSRIDQSSKKIYANSEAPQPAESSINRLQILYLRRLHGLTEAQAQAIAALVWGAM